MFESIIKDWGSLIILSIMFFTIMVGVAMLIASKMPPKFAPPVRVIYYDKVDYEKILADFKSIDTLYDLDFFTVGEYEVEFDRIKKRLERVG